MPRILRSPGSKSFRLENVSVPNADGARCERRQHPRRLKAKSALGQSLQKRDVFAKSAFPLIATGERTSRDVSNVPTTRTSRSEQSTRTYDYCPSNLYCPASHVSRATGDSEVERIY